MFFLGRRTLHDELMRARNERQAVIVVECL